MRLEILINTIRVFVCVNENDTHALDFNFFYESTISGTYRAVTKEVEVTF